MHEFKNIAVHNGALGDFLSAWPALHALAAHLGEAPRWWAGRAAYLPWLAPLGYAPARPELRRAVEWLYTAEEWPVELAGTRVIWFGLDKPPVDLRHPDLWLPLSLPGVATEPPTRALERQFAARGVPWREDWRAAWRRLFGGWRPDTLEGNTPVLLFPGAGHRAKQWPLVQFFELAALLASEGIDTCFVLGPAEIERGLDAAIAAEGTGYGTARPEDFAALSALLLSARAVVGNDCGPLHLAALHNVPTLALFGPTDERVWGPQGARCLAQDMPCRPCTATTRDLNCPHARCLSELPPAQVRDTLHTLLSDKES